MKISTKIKINLANSQKLKFENIAETENGTLYYDESSELEVGTEVYMKDGDGNWIAAPDGNYPYKGNILVVAESMVVDIIVGEDEMNKDKKESSTTQLSEVTKYASALNTELRTEVFKKIEELNNKVTELEKQLKDAKKESNGEFTKKDKRNVQDASERNVKDALSKFGL